MVQIFDSDSTSNTYFFLTNFSEEFKAGRNSFIINSTDRIVPDSLLHVFVYDSSGNAVPVGELKPTNAKYAEETKHGKYYYANIYPTTTNGVGYIEIVGKGLDVGDYSGRIAYYAGQAYKVSDTQRLPLTQAPNSSPIPQVDVIWKRNILIDSTKRTSSDVRFFDYPYIEVRPEIYVAPQYSTGSYSLSAGTFASIAVVPKNNHDGDHDYQSTDSIYQLYWKSGNKFNSSMEGEEIRLRNPLITKFVYNNYTNNEVTYQGVLDTDFIATIKRVVNDTTVLVDIPFSTVSDLVGRSNEDSEYASNNLVRLKGYTVNDDPTKQTVFHKKNFYALSISDGNFEVFHKDIPLVVPNTGESGSNYVKSLVNIECNNTRLLCGNLSSYKLYARSLNSPESRTVIAHGSIEPDEAIRSTNFNNGFRNNPAHFYDSVHLSNHWFAKGGCIIEHSNEVLINGAKVGHAGNTGLTDYIIFKDNTSTDSKNHLYTPYNLMSKSYWYAKANAFVNFAAYPSSSYVSSTFIPSIAGYGQSQENLLLGVVHDCNSIKLRNNTLYKFSMRVRAKSTNGLDAKLYVYYISGTRRKLIGYIDSSYNYGANELYERTFFNEEEKYGTIILVPVVGSWYISEISVAPFQDLHYSIDSFGIKVPVSAFLPNELYEFELEMYDEQNRLAYGKGSYTFTYNKRFLPLKKQIFIDPAGLTANYISVRSTETDLYFVDGGNASGEGPEYIDIILDGGDASSIFN